MIPTQNYNDAFNLYVGIPKGLMGQDVPSYHLEKLILMVNAAILPAGKDSPLVLYLCILILCE